jgi:hypothetical protein
MRRVIKEDYPTINKWYLARGMMPLSEHLYPDIGFIVENIGAGFLYQTDSALCFIDGYISSPSSDKEERRVAFDKITTAIVRTAKDHGFRSILAYTKNQGVKGMCDRFNFQFKGEYTLYVKEI